MSYYHRFGNGSCYMSQNYDEPMQYFNSKQSYNLKYDEWNIIQLYHLNVINEWEYDFYLDMLAKYKYTDKQIDKIGQIETKIKETKYI